MKNYTEVRIIGLYTLLFAFIVFGLKFLFFNELLVSSNFLHFDAEHYFWIKENGFEGFRVAFFPLFPLIWKLLTIDIHGIVIVNGVVFLVSIYLLIKDLKLSNLEILTYLSIPSFIFFFLPYSEALFFLGSSILIAGLKGNKISLVCIGLFISTLSRPAFTVFIPALIIAEFLSEDEKGKRFVRLGLYFLVELIGILLVGIIQYTDTGEWFKFFNVQQGWGNELQFPKLPLTSWAGGLIVRLDGAALFLGLFAGGFLTAYLLKLKHFRNFIIAKEVLFSLAYLGGISLSVLAFRGGSLFSLNRFVFATPFIIIAINYWFRIDYHFNPKQLLYIFGIIFAFWLFFGSYVHIQALLKFLLLTFYVFLIFAIKSDNKLVRNFTSVLLIVLNIAFQIFFYVRFLQGGWVG